MLLNVKGKWIKSADLGESNSSKYKAQQQEAYNRLDEIHNMVLKIYPEPTAIDAIWHRSIGISYFGSERKYYTNSNGTLTFDYLNIPSFSKYYYRCGFFAYYCGSGNVMWPGSTNETGTWLTVTANEIQGSVGGVAGDDSWTINGLPVRMRPPVLKTIRGYELQYPEPGSNGRYVLIHRKGILPYIPVTRKQYLDQCIINNTKLYDEMIKAQEQTPVRTLEEQETEKKARLAKFEKDFGNDPKRLKSAVDYYLSGYQTDQQQRDERVKNAKKIKEDEIKKFKDELEKTTKEGLLDSPAVVLVMYHPSPIFETDPLKGHMLVTENPGYIRKDLSKHIPQMFVVWWSWNNYEPQKEIGKIIEEKFPFEKLEAMIDK